MGLFTGIDEATSTQGGNYIRPGRHLLQIDVNRVKKSRKKKNLAFAEFTVLESTVHEPGEEVSWCVNLTDHDAGLGNISGYLAAVAECEESEVDEKGATRAYSAENPFKGFKVALTTFMIKTQSGGDFTKHEYKPASEWQGLATEKAERATEDASAAADAAVDEDAA